MAILTIYYLSSNGVERSYDTQPADLDFIMQRVMMFCQSGADVIQHSDTGETEILLLHRVLGMTIRPAV